MPADDRFWLDDEEVVAPARPEVVEPYPENAIRVPQSWSGIGAEGNLELVAKNQVLKGDVTT